MLFSNFSKKHPKFDRKQLVFKKLLEKEKFLKTLKVTYIKLLTERFLPVTATVKTLLTDPLSYR